MIMKTFSMGLEQIGLFQLRSLNPKWQDDAESSSSSLHDSLVFDATSPEVVCSELFNLRLGVDNALVTSARCQDPARVLQDVTAIGP